MQNDGTFFLVGETHDGKRICVQFGAKYVPAEEALNKAWLTGLALSPNLKAWDVTDVRPVGFTFDDLKATEDMMLFLRQGRGGS